MSENKEKTIGNLNGPWALMLKLLLVVNTVAIVPFGTYVVATLQSLSTQQAVADREFRSFIEVGPRYTTDDALKDQALMRSELEVKVIEMAGVLKLVQRDVEALKKNLMGP